MNHGFHHRFPPWISSEMSVAPAVPLASGPGAGSLMWGKSCNNHARIITTTTTTTNNNNNNNNDNNNNNNSNNNNNRNTNKNNNNNNNSNNNDNSNNDTHISYNTPPMWKWFYTVYTTYPRWVLEMVTIPPSPSHLFFYRWYKLAIASHGWFLTALATLSDVYWGW